MYTLNALRLFVGVARYGSVTKASVALRVSQPSISHEVRHLEQELDVKLYHRMGRGIQLTPEGRRLASRSKWILSEFENLKAEIRRTSKPETLTVGGGQGMSETLLSVLLAQYRTNHPLTKTILQTKDSRVIESLLLRSKIEIGFITFLPVSSRLAAELFSTDDVVPFAAVHHPLARKSKVTLQELAAIPLIIRKGNGTKEDIETMLGKFLGARLKPNIIGRFESSEAVESGVRVGTSVGLLSRAHLAQGIGQGSLKILCVPGFSMQIRRFIIYLKDKPLSPAGQDFLALLQAAKPSSKRQGSRHVAHPKKFSRALIAPSPPPHP